MTGDIAPRPHAGGRTARCDPQALTCVRRLVHEQCDATLEELCERLYCERGVRVSVPTMSRIVTHLELPRKKSRFTPVSGTPSASNRRGRLIKRRSPPSTPSASSASMNRASTSQ
jgi:transposase